MVTPCLFFSFLTRITYSLIAVVILKTSESKEVLRERTQIQELRSVIKGPHETRRQGVSPAYFQSYYFL